MAKTANGSHLRQQILTFIDQFRKEWGYSPAQREIALGVGTSLTNVYYHLNVLAKGGQIVRKRHAARALVATLTDATSQNPNTVYWIEQGEVVLGQLANPVVPLPRGTWMPPKPQRRR
jgi:SOS-response transcriptional repressor LexA